MTYKAALQAGRQDFFNLPFETLTSRFAAIGLVIASSGFGAVYAWQSGASHGYLLASLAVVMALSLEIAKPLAILAALDAIKRLAVMRAIAMAALGLVAVAYSLTAELQLMARGRSDAIAERATDNRNLSAAAALRDRLKTAADKLGNPTRSTAEVQALIDGKLGSRRDLGGCVGVAANIEARKVCTAVAELRAEHARAGKQEAAQADYRSAESALAEHGAEKKTDPGASALASYLLALGVIVKVDALGDWLVLVGVIALEVGSAFAGLLAIGTQYEANKAAPRASLFDEPKPEPVTQPTAIEPKAAVVAEPVTIAEPAIDTKASPVVRAVAYQLKSLAANNGNVLSFKSKRDLGRILDVSHGTASRALAFLAVSGSAVVADDAGEIVVQLVA